MLALIEKLGSHHALHAFDCGKQDLNRFLQRHALSNQQSNSSQTYVACRSKTVIGYYSLTVGGVTHTHASERVKKGMPAYPIPVIILARLAVDQSMHGQGVGSALLKDALLRSAAAADTVGVRALLVHAKDESAIEFYKRFDFDPSPTDPNHLFLLMKDIQKLMPKK